MFVCCFYCIYIFIYFNKLGCGKERLCGMAAVMVRDTAHSSGGGGNFTFCSLFVSHPKREEVRNGEEYKQVQVHRSIL